MMFVSACFLTLIVFGALQAALAWSRRVWGLPLEWCRKITHVAMGVICLSFPLFVSTAWQAVGLAVLFTAALVLLRWKSQLLWGGGSLLPSSRCESEGEFYFVAGIALALLLARDNWFVYLSSILTLAFADSAAAFVGKAIGRRHCWKNAKTLEGSLAFFFIAALCFSIASVAIETSCDIVSIGVVCLLATVAEGVSERGSDNLSIPLVCVVGLQFHRWIPEMPEALTIVAVMAVILAWVAIRKPLGLISANGGQRK